MKTGLFKTIAGLALISNAPLVFAGPSGAFMCSSQSPYDYVGVDASHEKMSISSQSLGRLQANVGGLVTPGQSIKAKSANGIALAPALTEKGDEIGLINNSKKMSSYAGRLYDWDIHEGKDGSKAYFTTYEYDDAKPDSKVIATQRVVDQYGKTIAERNTTRTPNEETGEYYSFTQDGSGIYLIPDPMQPKNDIEVLDASTLKPKLTISLPSSLKVTSLAFRSSTDGVAIAGDRLFLIRNGKIISSSVSRSPFVAKNITIDQRSNRILVNGIREFMVLDLNGNPLYQQKFGTDAPIVTNAKIAIDGSIGFTDPGTGETLVRTRASAYKAVKPIPIAKDAWAQVQCFTPESAALVVNGDARLIKF